MGSGNTGLTSFDNLQKSLGKHWRPIHLLTVPALLLGTIHIVLIGSHQLQAVILSIITLMVLLVRWRLFWSLLSLEKFYTGSKNR